MTNQNKKKKKNNLNTSYYFLNTYIFELIETILIVSVN